MSEAQRDAIGSIEQCKVGPDFFSFYAREIADLLSENENTLSTSNLSELGKGKYGVVNGKYTEECSGKVVDSYFENSIGVGFSDFKKGRLKALLRQSVNDLSMELDEMLDPVLAMCELRSKLRSKSLLTSNGNTTKDARKKLKMSSSCSSTSVTGNSCDMKSRSCKEVDDDLQFLLENDNPLLVEETMKKYSDELSSTLSHMEQKLEETLDTIISKCRPMTLAEKRQLQKLIQKLPQENLARVIEIIQRGRPAGTPCGEEIFVDLEREDNVTLWTLYYYVEAVEKAKILAHSQCNTTPTL